ncbi:MAG: helix-turn-helix domain-containing protein [Bacteroidales bacterium]|nr:helix-turn-helix domain-containing protein [Candidatus Physcousia equi]
MQKVSEGVLTVSAIYPTHGDELMELALNILNGKSYEKETQLETSLVTQSNARVLLMQYKEIESQIQYIKRMHARVDTILGQLDTERIILFGIIGMTLILAVFSIITVRAYRIKQQLNQELFRKNEELNEEKAVVERQRDQLEEQCDQLLDMTEKLKVSAVNEGKKTDAPQATSPSSPQPTPLQDHHGEENRFVDRFLLYVDDHLSDSDLSVEDIGADLGLSRVQLYRKIKTMTGKTPVEIIREERLKRAKVLLEDSSLSISEVAYKVGFSAPSYFTKCYKDYYGKAPSGK